MEKLFLGIKGHIVCLDQETGNELWRSKLKADWGKATVVVYSKNLFVYLAGTFYCICPKTGEIKWENPLKGLGSGSCAIALENKSAIASADTVSQGMMTEAIDTAIDIAM